MSDRRLAALRSELERKLRSPRELPVSAWIFGAGGFGRALRLALEDAGVAVRGFIATNGAGEHDGLPLRDISSGPADRSPVFVGIFNHRADSSYGTLAAALRGAGFAHPFWPQESYDLLGDRLGWRYWLAPRRAYLDAWDTIGEAHRSLADGPSRDGLVDLLRFRLLDHDAPPRPCGEPQYFPDLLRATLPSKTVWVDGGACDGDTIAASADLIDTELCFAFEPDPTLYARLVANADRLDVPVVRLPLGLSDRTGTLAFQPGAQGAGTVDPAGAVRLSFARLDDLLHRRAVDLVKLDVEGHEVAALQGAARLIRTARPRLAIAAYHRWRDIPDLLCGLAAVRSDYRFFLRIHEHNGFDTVLYAV